MGRLGYFVSFVMGGALASLITWKVCEKKYKDISDKEIESVKKAFSNNVKIVLSNKKEDILNEGEEKKIVENKKDYDDKVNKYGYASKYKKVLDELKEKNEVKEDDGMGPYIISPDDFGELADYETVSLIYYTGDGVVATERDEVIDDVDETVGLDNLDRFGEYTEDCIFVRNDKLKTDYEILRDVGSFGEGSKSASYSAEDDD